jgi:hypothetical protein
MASVRFPLLSSFSDSELTYPTLASRNIYASAQRLRNPGGEFPVAPENLLRLTWCLASAVSLTLSLREQESPNGLSLTSRFVDRFSRRHVLTAGSSPATVGTLSKPRQSAVSPTTYLSFPSLLLTFFFLDQPDVGPGTDLV